MSADDLDNLPHDRRSMFRIGLRKILKPVAEVIESRIEELRIPLPQASLPRTVLRPPGALPEKEFLDTCYRCGNCMDVCPARCIRSMSSGDAERAGTPYIDPDLSACVVCDELACMKACPSGALKLVEAPTSINMGMARVSHPMCVRSHGEECTLCVDKCPFGTSAIEVGETSEIVVKLGGCVGCGVCQFYCPTLPKAIVVDPV